ncbi:MAG: DNA repair protein RecN [Bacilli bacterium]|jgi:DNA repair protein RecN (Recombination protein N)|nr:DNA repair protein RecN [Bacilli bacterium]
MLAQLRVTNFALIADLDVVFKPGMDVILGQTGAGKTLLVEAIGLLSGKRAEFDKLKDETKKALVEGTFVFTDQFISEHEELVPYLEDKTMVVTRTLLPSKAAIARINGENVSLSKLKELMDSIIDIHSQRDSLLLYQEQSHLALLDALVSLAGQKQALVSFKEAYVAYQEAKKAIEDFKKDNNLAEKDYLSFQVQELEKASIKPHEIEDLESELEALSGFEKAEKAYKDLMEALGEEEEEGSLEERLSSSLRSLEGFFGTSLEEEAKRTQGSINELQEALNGLKESFNGLSASPERLEELNSRLFELSSFQRKYGKSTAEILSAYDSFKKRLENLENYDEEEKELEKKAEKALDELTLKGKSLTLERQKEAKKLTGMVNEELASLGLKDGGFKAEVIKGELTEKGFDKALFTIAMNEGGRFLPLKEAISGGENSRLTLALKAVFNKLTPYDTLIFDEIDTGISGNIAAKAAEKMHELASSSLVLAISHLPQVAARADNCYFVYKETFNGETTSHLKELSPKEGEEEIARLISGSDLTKEALKAAKALKASFH